MLPVAAPADKQLHVDTYVSGPAALARGRPGCRRLPRLIGSSMMRPIGHGMTMGPSRRGIRRWHALAVLCASIVVGVGGVATWQWRSRAAVERIETHGSVPDFSLVERSGRTITRADFLGRVSIVDFFYTRCPDACPLQSAHLARLQRTFAGAPDVLLVSISVDPDYDTPDVLRRYAASFGADPTRWLFLTGSRGAVYHLAVDGFHLAVATSTIRPPRWPWALMRPARAWAHTDDGRTDVIQLVHLSWFALVDRQGRIREYFDGTDWSRVERLQADVRHLLARR